MSNSWRKSKDYEKHHTRRRSRSRSKERYEKYQRDRDSEKHRYEDSEQTRYHSERSRYHHSDGNHHSDQRHRPERSSDEFQERDGFDFTHHKHSLNKIFFRDQDLIKRFVLHL